MTANSKAEEKTRTQPPCKAVKAIWWKRETNSRTPPRDKQMKWHHNSTKPALTFHLSKVSCWCGAILLWSLHLPSLPQSPPGRFRASLVSCSECTGRSAELQGVLTLARCLSQLCKYACCVVACNRQKWLNYSLQQQPFWWTLKLRSLNKETADLLLSR